MQVIVDSLLAHYEDEGEGKVVVLLHGWGDSSAGLQSLRAALKKRHRVISLDLPGFGNTQPPQEPWGLNNYVDFVQQFLQKIHAPAVWSFVGHSNGGAIIIRGLADGRFESDRAVLIASAGIRDVYKGRKRALRILAKTAKVITAPLPKAVTQKLRKKAYQQIGSDMLVVEGMQETFKRVVGEDVRPDAAQLRMPVLLIYGEADDSTPLWFGQQFHELMVDSTLVVMPGAGHFVHLERPEEVAKQVQEFLA